MPLHWLFVLGKLWVIFLFSNVFFCGQTCFWWYLIRNGCSDRHEIKKKCIDSMFSQVCYLDLYLNQPWPWSWIVITPLQQNWTGYTDFTLLCQSIRPSVDRIVTALVSSTILTGSLFYLHILSPNFGMWVVCQVVEQFRNLNFWHLF